MSEDVSTRENATEADDWVERVHATRRRVEALTREQQEHGAQLGNRYYALAAARHVLAGDLSPTEERKAEILECLQGVAEEAHAEFLRYCEEVGVDTLER